MKKKYTPQQMQVLSVEAQIKKFGGPEGYSKEMSRRRGKRKDMQVDKKDTTSSK